MARVAFQGLGDIGLRTAEIMLSQEKHEIVGAADVNHDYKGKSLGDLLKKRPEDDRADMVRVYQDPKEMLEKEKPEILMLATSSYWEDIIPSMTQALLRDVKAIITCCEEAFYPVCSYPSDVESLDRLAQENNAAIIPTGINPGGFESFALMKCREHFSLPDGLKGMILERNTNTLYRRKRLQEKTGLGLTVQEFEKLEKEGRLGHCGLEDSMRFLGDNILGEDNYEMEFYRQPLLAGDPFVLEGRGKVKEGKVLGIHEHCVITHDGEWRIWFDLFMHPFAGDRNIIDMYGRKGNTEHSAGFDLKEWSDGDTGTAVILNDAVRFALGTKERGYLVGEYAPDLEKLKVHMGSNSEKEYVS